MIHRKSISIGMVSLLLLALLLSSIAGTGASAQATSGTVEPPQGAAGTLFSFTASGFGSSEPVNVWLEDPQGRTRTLGTDVASNRIFATVEGSASWVWQSPDNAPAGDWLAVARGANTRRMLTIPVVVEGTQTGTPLTSYFVDPRNGPPGTTFTFVGRSTGFNVAEQVGSWFIQPDGTQRDVQEGQSVDPNGQIFRIWTAPLDAQPGVWIFRARGISSGYVLDMYFRIDPPDQPIDLPPPPPLFVTPASGPAGTLFTFTVGGFQSGEIVGNWLIRPDNTSTDAGAWQRADGDGVLVWQWQSPADTPAGVWRFRASGTQTRGYEELAFVVEGNNPLPPAGGLPPGQVFPSAGAPDTSFILNAEGFLPDERAFFWLATADGQPALDPQGRVIVEETELQADRDGRVSWVWEAPNRTPPGNYQIIVRGRLTSPLVIQIPLTITDPNRPTVPTPPPVVPADGSPGVEFSFFASGFTSGELLDIFFIAPDGTTFGRDNPGYAVIDQTSSRRGYAEFRWKAPATIVAGTWQIVVRGRDSRVTRTIPFRIFRTDTDAPPYSVVPESGLPGTTFTFTADGFPPNSRVGYWMTRPDRSIIRIGDPEYEADEIGSDANGRVIITWDSPDTVQLQRGVWHLTMRTSKPDSLEEDVTYIIYFTVE